MKLKNDSNKVLKGRTCVYNENRKVMEWKEVSVHIYEANLDIFRCVFEKKPDKYVDIPRLFICFDAENPIKYIWRLKNAIIERFLALNQVKFNLIVDLMP